MLIKLNAGWTYSLLALLCVFLSIPLILTEIRWGMKWRGEREERQKTKLSERQGKEHCREEEMKIIEKENDVVHRS